MNVLWLSAEDAAETAIVPRLEAAGADLDRVDILDHVLVGDKEVPLVLPDHLDLVGRLIAERGVELVVADPLNGFILARLDSHVDADLRASLLYPLKKLTEATGAAVLCVRHLNKSSGGKAVYRCGGSIDFTGAARVSLLVGTDPDDDTRRALAVTKSTVGPIQPAIEYQIDTVSPESTGDMVSRVRWGRTCELTAQDLGSAPTPKRGRPAAARDEAADFLRDTLGAGPVSAKDVEAGAIREGISPATLRAARERLGVLTPRVNRRSMWRLPDPTCGEFPSPPNLQQVGENSGESGVSAGGISSKLPADLFPDERGDE